MDNENSVHVCNGVYSTIINEICRKWMELENILLNEVIHDQKDKISHSFSYGEPGS